MMRRWVSSSSTGIDFLSIANPNPNSIPYLRLRREPPSITLCSSRSSPPPSLRPSTYTLSLLLHPPKLNNHPSFFPLSAASHDQSVTFFFLFIFFYIPNVLTFVVHYPFECLLARSTMPKSNILSYGNLSTLLLLLWYGYKISFFTHLLICSTSLSIVPLLSMLSHQCKAKFEQCGSFTIYVLYCFFNTAFYVYIYKFTG